MKRDDVAFLNQLVMSMQEAESKLEKAYGRKDADNFNQSKKIMLEIQKEISEILEQ